MESLHFLCYVLSHITILFRLIPSLQFKISDHFSVITLRMFFSWHFLIISYGLWLGVPWMLWSTQTAMLWGYLVLLFWKHIELIFLHQNIIIWFYLFTCLLSFLFSIYLFFTFPVSDSEFSKLSNHVNLSD